MSAASYRQRAHRCFEEARRCHDVLIARMLDDLGREFEAFARELDAAPPAAIDTARWPGVRADRKSTRGKSSILAA